MLVEDILAEYPGATHLKSGGQKAVFHARTSRFGECVLKIGEVDSPDTLARIEREVDLLKTLDSKYFPKHYHFELRSGSRFLIVEEYIHASSLSDYLADFRNRSTLFDLRAIS